MIKINLLSGKRKVILERQVQARQYTKQAVMAALVIGAVTLAVVAARAVLGVQANRLAVELEEKNTRLQEYEEVAKQSFMIAERIQALRGIIEGRKDLEEKLEIFTKLNDTDFSLDAIGFGSEMGSNVLEVRAGTTSMTVYEQAENQLLSIAEEHELTEVFTNNLRHGEAWNMQVDLLLVLGKTGEVTKKKGS